MSEYIGHLVGHSKAHRELWTLCDKGSVPTLLYLCHSVSQCKKCYRAEAARTDKVREVGLFIR